MSAIDNSLEYNRRFFLSIVSEHYLNDKLQQAMIYRFDKRPLTKEPIVHGAWEFVYDDKQNVIYIQ